MDIDRYKKLTIPNTKNYITYIIYKMTTYYSHGVSLSEGQKQKLVKT